MKKIKVLLTSRLSTSEMKYLENEIGKDFEFIIPNSYSEEDIIKVLDDDINIILGNYVSKNILESGNIKLIQNPFAGVENFNFELLRDYEIILVNSHSNSKAVAEHALGLIFSITRKIPYHDKMLRQGEWNRDMKEVSLFSSSIIGKNVGILGYGGIGRFLGKMLKSFDCNIMGMVRDKDRNYEELDFIGDKNDMDYIISKSDILVSALPLTNDTEGILDKKKLSMMKESGYLINISRGPVVEEGALYHILKEEKIAGAAIDTWYNYPKDFNKVVFPSLNYPFHELNNIVMSPHRAAMSKGEMNNVIDVVENFKRYKNGEELINIVDINSGY